MFRRPILFSHTAMLFIIAIYGFVMSTETTSGGTRMSVSCWLFPLTCPASVAWVGAEAAAQANDGGFVVVNKSDSLIRIASAWYAEGQELQPIGIIQLPIVTKGHWNAKGWVLLKPGESTVVRNSNLSFPAFIRIEMDGRAIPLPGDKAGPVFCTLDGDFESREDVVDTWFLLYPARGSGQSGESCATAGGQLREFHRMPNDSRFVVSPLARD